MSENKENNYESERKIKNVYEFEMIGEPTRKS